MTGFGGMTYQKAAAPFQSMVKRFDGSAFSNPMMNGLQSYTNPLVPQSGGSPFDPMQLFWWLKTSQMSKQQIPGMPYTPNKYAR